MPPLRPPNIAVSDPNENGVRQRRAIPSHVLSRSPHPYHHPPAPQLTPESSNPERFATTGTHSPGCPSPWADSGTEADDEGLEFAKALPAAPRLSRKGLKDGSEEQYNSYLTPRPTPSLEQEEWTHQPGPPKQPTQTLPTQDVHARDASISRKKAQKRTAAEFRRRAFEIILLSLLTALVCHEEEAWSLVQRSQAGNGESTLVDNKT